MTDRRVDGARIDVVGWPLNQADADSESSYVVGARVVSGNDLTERQREMVDVAGPSHRHRTYGPFACPWVS